ncbi:heme exporter protein CcmB [Dongia rigui]|uniref:Heme exporter protein B n=1 Tax=Dongia rigui TaxID=940149 RepID=A0ABU5DYB1_9PROT|nr:heme exporter protein CcmB [Dongia rigui]MDY0871546.1 heme exporter protein CcmB [Dongia rigui]
MRAFRALLKRDLGLGLRQGIDALVVVLFFLAAGALFPFALGPEPQLLARIAAGIVMSMAALASLLSLDRLFTADYEDGSLDGLALSPLSLELVALAKVATHWLMTGLPLLAAAPVLGLLLNLAPGQYPILLLSLVLVTPALSLLGALGAALTLGARRGGVLLAFLILPLFIPILILGMGAVSAAAEGQSALGALELLAALDLGLLALVPWAMATALRQVLR